MTRVAIYARYSDDKQSAASIEDQWRLCELQASKQGWTVVDRFCDRAISGASVILRPGVQSLLTDALARRFDIVLAEALDRVSRDQEDVAGLYKRLSFAGVKLITLSEGEITPLHVGLKGTMNALFLKDLADKVRRGLRGRVEAGKAGGGNSYGYDVVRRLAEDGEPARGERTINEAEAEIVRHIFREYAAGKSPKRIATELNAAGIPAPSGGAWGFSTLNGNVKRGNGILNNELYVGRLVWNRQRFIKDPDTGKLTQVPVTRGHCKLQWKADWAMRWAALGVDYEMAGKDLIDSVRLSGHICRILGAQQPEGFIYELFLDEKGEKISKSRGNGLTIEEWLAYATPESLALYMYQSPRKAKRLYFDVIPKAVDEYVGHLAAFPKEEPAAMLMNPVWHIHQGEPPQAELPISFPLLLNLASASNSEDREVLWGFIRRYAPDATPEDHPLLDQLVGFAIRYFHDFVKPAKLYRPPTEKERAALADLDQRLAKLPKDVLAEEIVLDPSAWREDGERVLRQLHEHLTSRFQRERQEQLAIRGDESNAAVLGIAQRFGFSFSNPSITSSHRPLVASE